MTESNLPGAGQVDRPAETSECAACGCWVEAPGKVCLDCWLEGWRSQLVRQADGSWRPEAVAP